MLIRPQLMAFDGIPVSDHNRSELSVTLTKALSSKRMLSGTMRQIKFSTKSSFSVSWNDLPHKSDKTVDKYMGAETIKNFYASTDAFDLSLAHHDATSNVGNGVIPGIKEMYRVSFTEDCSFEIVKRWKNIELWNISLEMVEI